MICKNCNQEAQLSKTGYCLSCLSRRIMNNIVKRNPEYVEEYDKEFGTNYSKPNWRE